MPMLRIRGITEEKIKEVSHPLVEELHKIIGCPKDYFTLENNYYENGEHF